MSAKILAVIVLSVCFLCVFAENVKKSPRNSRKHKKLSTPLECARTCRDSEPPKICYYHFTLEFYTVLGGACDLCRPNATNMFTADCQCVLADGIERTVLTANRMLPGPSIQVCLNDKIVIDVDNHMEGQEVVLHWHGIFQNGSQFYDGAPFITQCPIHEGTRFRYQFIAGNAGTHFWHSHSGLQKLDGIYGSLVVRQPVSEDPHGSLYDYDLTTHVMLLSDFMHELASEKFPGRRVNGTRQQPDNLLINGMGRFTDPIANTTTNTPLAVFKVTPGRRYRFRMINSFCTVCPARLTIEGHNLTVIASDGIAVKPAVVTSIISFSGERYDFVIKTKKTSGAYWIQLRGLGECGNHRVQQLGILRYADGPSQPSSTTPTYDQGLPRGVVLNPLDANCDESRPDAICVSQLQNAESVDPAILTETPDLKVFIPFRFRAYTANELFVPRTYNKFLVAATRTVVSLVDDISFMSPPSPLLSQYHDVDPGLFCSGDNTGSCQGNCTCIHKIDIPLNATVEIVLVDEIQVPNLSHPFHLHGYAFNVIGMGLAQEHNMEVMNLKIALDLDRKGLLKRRIFKTRGLPPGKDTIAVPTNGYVVLRFRATNPGFWLMHCHFLYHIAIGMSLVLQVGSQSDIPPVPRGFPTCGDYVPPISY